MKVTRARNSLRALEVLALYRNRSGGTALEERSKSRRPERFRYEELAGFIGFAQPIEPFKPA